MFFLKLDPMLPVSTTSLGDTHLSCVPRRHWTRFLLHVNGWCLRRNRADWVDDTNSDMSTTTKALAYNILMFLSSSYEQSPQVSKHASAIYSRLLQSLAANAGRRDNQEQLL